PPSGMAGSEVLRKITGAFGIDVSDDITAELGSIVKKQLGDLAAFYWNTGEERPESGRVKLLVPEAGTRPSLIAPPMVHSEKYRKEIREVGTERFRVRR
ncbi:MAG: hypothetical protein KAV42_02765, partial [Candidatus Krumholzibacteria bacterium]|nr:hypothetical protein [Candidatus Krumholzibacteria bacterium]